MRAVFAMVLITRLGSATRKPSETQGQTYLELDTQSSNLQIELSADAQQIVVQERSPPNSSSVLQSFAEDEAPVPFTGEDPFSTTGGANAKPGCFRTTCRGDGHQEYTYLSLLGFGGFGDTWLAVEGKPRIIEQLLAENSSDDVGQYNSGLQAWHQSLARREKNVAVEMPVPKWQSMFPDDITFPAKVAIKVSQRNLLLLTEEMKRAMWNEVHILQKLKGISYVSAIHEAFQDLGSFSGAGRYYIVMEYFPGGNLWHRVLKGRHSMQAAQDWFHELLMGLDAIHKAGVAHRDIKLENIMLTTDGKPKFIDFGLAVIVGNSTGFSDRVGSPSYAAPEVGMAKEMGPYQPYKADIWSLGVVLFAIVSSANGNVGVLPFTGNQVHTSTRTWGSVQEKALSDRGVNQDVVSICRDMLATNADDRESDIAKLLAKSWNL